MSAEALPVGSTGADVGVPYTPKKGVAELGRRCSHQKVCGLN